MKKKQRALWIAVAVLLLVFVFPYARVELLSINAEKKLEDFDITCFDNVYCEGTPAVYDCKIYHYWKEHYAKVLYILGDCEFGVMIELKWDQTNACWEIAGGKTMWTVYGGSAQEFYWPLYYADKLYPLYSERIKQNTNSTEIATIDTYD